MYKKGDSFKRGIAAIEDYFLAVLDKRRVEGKQSFDEDTSYSELYNILSNLNQVQELIPTSVSNRFFLESFGSTKRANDIHRLCLENMGEAVRHLHV